MRTFAVLVLFVSPAFVRAGVVDSFDDIEYWVGSGVNRAAFVVDWNSGTITESYAWGYRWDGSKTGEDMFRAVVAADPRLFAKISVFGWGSAANGIGYDANDNGVFATSPAAPFDANGISESGPDDGSVAQDAGDLYAEGWNTGYWSYWLNNGNPYSGGSWDSGMEGFSTRVLTDGAWDGWSFHPGFTGPAPSIPTAAQVAAVPEPNSLTLLLVGSAGAMVVRRRKRRAAG